MLALTETDVRELLDMPRAIALMEDAFRAQAQDRVKLPPRTLAGMQRGVLGCMPAAIMAAPGSTQAAVLGAKLVSVYASNAERGLPTHQALVLLFDSESGTPMALMDGRFITEARTAATSALATRLLAAPDARVLAILGTGVQARSHIDALRNVMRIDELRIWGRSCGHAEQLADFARTLKLNPKVSRTVSQATHGAQVICTVTAAREPLLAAADVDKGAHINAVGFAFPRGRELAADLMQQARIVVDSIASALSEAGDIILAIADGALPAQPELISLCDVVEGRKPGRRSQSDITVFKSVGLAIEDLVCAGDVYVQARAQGKGVVVEI